MNSPAEIVQCPWGKALRPSFRKRLSMTMSYEKEIGMDPGHSPFSLASGGELAVHFGVLSNS